MEEGHKGKINSRIHKKGTSIRWTQRHDTSTQEERYKAQKEQRHRAEDTRRHIQGDTHKETHTRRHTQGTMEWRDTKLRHGRRNTKDSYDGSIQANGVKEDGVRKQTMWEKSVGDMKGPCAWRNGKKSRSTRRENTKFRAWW